MHDIIEFKNYLGEVDKQMRDMEERFQKHVES